MTNADPTQGPDKDFIEYTVKQLVEFPDEVRVDRIIDEMGVLLKLYINKEDMGKVIGKEGRTAKALRTLLRVIGAKHNMRVNLKIMDEGEGEGDDAGAEAFSM